jgi:cytoskeletal protein CcmA (bactofilin family)
MFKKTEVSKKVSDHAHTLISTSTELVGDVHFSGELIVEGLIKGNIYAADESDAMIRVAKTGTVEGEICVPSIVINGVVKGDVRSTEHVELAAKAIVLGNVYYNLIEMVMGSEVNGNLMHISSTQQDTKRLGIDRKFLPANNNLRTE